MAFATLAALVISAPAAGAFGKAIAAAKAAATDTTPPTNTRSTALRDYDEPRDVSRPLARVSAVVLAAKGAPAIVRGGETAATAYGRAIHKTFDYGPGFRREFSLPSGRRADAVNLRTREVVELKPNNPRAIALGRRQL